ncbi:MAG: hypothetical protein E3J35_03000 [Methanomassiliicoccales archaeon]|nr:MAG: hypothetical protein E3J35_03000 [Methanomassiliicoccales archaeon]
MEEDRLSIESSEEGSITETTPLPANLAFIGRRITRVPVKSNRLSFLLIIGVGSYLLGLFSLWVFGSILISAFMAVLGTSLIIGSMHIEERARLRWGRVG